MVALTALGSSPVWICVSRSCGRESLYPREKSSISEGEMRGVLVVGGGRYIAWNVPGSDPGCVVCSWGGVRGGEDCEGRLA